MAAEGMGGAIAWFVIGLGLLLVIFLAGGIYYATQHAWVTNPANQEDCVRIQALAAEARKSPKEAVPKTGWPPAGIKPSDLPPEKKNAPLGVYGDFLSDKAAKACYCERVHPGMIKQPASTWSTLGFPIVGLAILLGQILERGKPEWAPKKKNAMTDSTFFAGWYGVVIILMGPGSMCLHATMSKIGGFLDLMSLVLFSSFILAYDFSGAIEKLGGTSRVARIVWFVIFYAVCLVGIGGLIYWQKYKVQNGNPTLLFILSGIIAGFLDMVMILWVFRRNRFFFWGGGRLFALAFVLWLFSQGVGHLCNPDTVFQWHAWWHLVAALFVGWIYLYLRTEEPGAPYRSPA
jgi:hypothetical protein